MFTEDTLTSIPATRERWTRNRQPTMNRLLDLHTEVAAALAAGRPVVALESTIISHGMPWPQNVETALAVEAEVRAHGACRRRSRSSTVA